MKTTKKTRKVISNIFVKQTDSLATQIFRFGIAGALATVVDGFTLFSLTHFLKVPYLISTVLGFCLGILVSYIISIRWVFASRTIKSPSMEFLIFFVIGIIALALTASIIYVSVEAFHLHYMVGKAIAIVIVFIWNFGARRVIMFRDSKSAAASENT
jgi:putative flippase GtrA